MPGADELRPGSCPWRAGPPSAKASLGARVGSGLGPCSPITAVTPCAVAGTDPCTVPWGRDVAGDQHRRERKEFICTQRRGDPASLGKCAQHTTSILQRSGLFLRLLPVQMPLVPSRHCRSGPSRLSAPSC